MLCIMCCMSHYIIQGYIEEYLRIRLYNIYTADIPPPRALVQVMVYADDIATTSTYTSRSAAKKYIQPYLHKVFVWTKQNNLTLNPGKTTCALFTLDPAEYKINLDIKINNTALYIIGL